MNKPYLSIVATTRNDNHGGDLLKRTTCFVEGIYHQAKNFNVAIELIIIEWNPPADKKLLKDVLPKPPKGSPVVLRYIVVPNEIHLKYRMADRMPLFQMTAKNVGIRLAKGEFVLCTNIDLLFSNELFDFLSMKKLNKNHFYRANRVDVPAKVMEFDEFDDKLSFGNKNIIEILGKRKGQEYIFGIPSFFYGFESTIKFLNNIYEKVLSFYYSEENLGMFSLDTSACGDFTLMHKDDWLKIEGYPELDLYSIHIDSMGLIAARAMGLQQEILAPKQCSYHIYHENGWESFKESPIDLIKFIEKRPGLDWHSVYETGKWMIKNKKTWGLNKPTWGFSDKQFKEYIFEQGKEMIEIN
jgi:hypothetical protein